MRKEFARLSGKLWIEKDRRSKREVIAEARKTGEAIHFSKVHGLNGEKVLNSRKEIHAASTKAAQ